jgi:hypothetical protein
LSTGGVFPPMSTPPSDTWTATNQQRHRG